MVRGSFSFGWAPVVLGSLIGLLVGSPAQATSPQEAAAQVDRLLTVETIAEAPQKRAPRADDQTFLRRAFLDIIGSVPTPDDVVAFSLDRDPQKRQKLVRKLLADKQFGRNWGNYWRDVIMLRRSEERSLLVSRSLHAYLTEQFNKNSPWSEIATDFVTASGDVREVGSTGLIAAQGGRPEETVAEISRIFMGIQIQCAQCHDHPTDRWKREQFHELAAFFPRIAFRPQRNGQKRTFLVVATDFRGFRARKNNNNRYRGTLEHRMPDLEDPSAEGKLMAPKFFVTGQQLSAGVRDAERRGTFARWMTSAKNPWFAKAYVNRMWAELVGEGFCEPVDDMGPDRECSAPRTLDYLAGEFVSNGHDVKWLMQTIMATAAYQRETRSRRSPDGTPFLANCSQRLRGDQLYDALLTALDIREPRIPQRAGQVYRGNGIRGVFNQLFGYDPSVRRDEVAGSIPQALALMNSPTINRAISANRRGGLGGMLRKISDNETVVNELYLKTLAREPKKQEVRTCLTYLREVGNRREAFEDILWALVNSTEFLHRR